MLKISPLKNHFHGNGREKCKQNVKNVPVPGVDSELCLLLYDVNCFFCTRKKNTCLKFERYFYVIHDYILLNRLRIYHKKKVGVSPTLSFFFFFNLCLCTLDDNFSGVHAQNIMVKLAEKVWS